MGRYETTCGQGRTKVMLSAEISGESMVVSICNENAHIGAVALGEYYEAGQRASTSVITRLGHKDDKIAQRAAYLISRQTHKACCVIAGAHLDDIREAEIRELLANSEAAVKEYLAYLEQKI